jgi:outer membrane protein assembly factor BamB
MRKQTVMPQEFVACFDLRNGRMLWRQRLCAAEPLVGAEFTTAGQTLLTYAEDTLYCSTGLGAIIAVSAEDGRIEWTTLYPRQGVQRSNLLDEPWHVQRDVTPCLFYRGLVIAAPPDCRAIFALEANTGQLVWSSEFAQDAVHLLGVAQDRLIATGQRVWWLDVFTGRPSSGVAVNPFPAGRHATPRGRGRGLLAGDRIYWPARGEYPEIHVLDQRSGLPVRPPINLSLAGARAGNLLVAQGHLIIAAARRLWVFNSTGRAQPKSLR